MHLRFGLRMLAKNPGFTAAAVLCLALGIGATTAIFSVVNAVLLRPLPYKEADRLARVFTEFPTFPNGGLRHFWVSPPEYFELHRDLRSWQDLEGWVTQGVNLAGATEPVRTTAASVTGGMLRELGVAPLFGRLTSADDDRPGVPQTAVISYGLWQRAFGGDRSVLGRDVRLNGEVCTVVGVMPQGFAFPPGELDPPELWTPLQLDPAQTGNRGSHFLNLVGRLRDGVSLAQARAEAEAYVQGASQAQSTVRHRFDPRTHTLVLAGFQEEVVGGVRRAMLVLLGAVVFVLLIACVNVANLLLARAEARRREIAVRTAIGAGLGRLLQQFLVEGLLLSFAGAVLGTGLAYGGLRVLAATNAGSIPRAAEIGIDGQVLLFTLAIAFATGMAFALAPVIHVQGNRLLDALKAGAGRSIGSRAANRFRAALVAGELALALVLLIGSGLMVKAFWKLQEVDAGFEPAHVLTMQLALPAVFYNDDARVTGFWAALIERVNALPGVVSSSMATELPPVRKVDANDTGIEGFVPRPGGPIQNIDYWNTVGPDYFQSMGIRLIDGRFLTRTDGPGAPPVVVVNRTLARTYWPQESALGHKLKIGPQWRTIVGIVGDARNAGLDHTTGTELYIPFLQVPRRFTLTAYLVVRAQGAPETMTGAVRAAIQGIDRTLPVAQVRTMEEAMSTARSRPRFLTLLLGLFSSLSLVLAALGLYGVISYSVAQRTGELGVRMALGAGKGDVLRLVIANGFRTAVIGAAAGAVGAFALTRVLSGLLFGVSAADAVTFGAMTLALLAVALAACYIPALRASRLDPLTALRCD